MGKKLGWVRQLDSTLVSEDEEQRLRGAAALFKTRYWQREYKAAIPALHPRIHSEQVTIREET